MLATRLSSGRFYNWITQPDKLQLVWRLQVLLDSAATAFTVV